MTRRSGDGVRGRRLRARPAPEHRAARTTRRTSLENDLTAQLGAFAATWPSLKPPVSNRTHCIVWSDWAIAAEGGAPPRHPLRHELLLQGPAGLGAQARPDDGLRLPAALRRPRRLDDRRLPGDDAGHRRDRRDASDDRRRSTRCSTTRSARSSTGASSPSSCTRDSATTRRLNDLVADAQRPRRAGGLAPRRCSTGSTAATARRSANIALQRRTSSVLADARNAEGARPRGDAARALGTGPLSQLTRDGQPVSWKRRTVKGVDYVVFDGTAGAYTATYANDTTRAGDHRASPRRPTARATRPSSWTTDEPSTSLVEYGRTTALGNESVGHRARSRSTASSSAACSPDTTYRFRVTSADSAGNTASSPPPVARDASRRRRARSSTRRTAEFAAGTQQRARCAGQTLDGLDGEVQLQPAVGDEFDGGARCSGCVDEPCVQPGGTVVARGRGARRPTARVAHTTGVLRPRRGRSSSRRRSEPVNDQAVGFGNDLTDYPMAAFTTGNDGDPSGSTPGAAPGPARRTRRRCPARRLGVPHRFRIEWRPSTVELLRRTACGSRSTLRRHHRRPAAPGLQRLRALRRERRRSTGCAWAATPRPARSRRACSTAARARTTGRRSRRSARCPTGTAIAFETRSGGDVGAGRELVGVAAGRRRRRDREPGRALHPVPRDA